jgi:hypothetical protein
MGRVVASLGGLAVDVVQMQNAIDECAVTIKGKRTAPHVFTIKVDWNTRKNASARAVKDLEHEVAAVAIDYINDQFYQTLSPVSIVVEDDIYATDLSVVPSFGNVEKSRNATAGIGVAANAENTRLVARLVLPTGDQDIPLRFGRGADRLMVGRAEDNDLHIDHDSVAKVHAVLMMQAGGAIMVGDVGSKEGTFLNGRRLGQSETHEISKRDIVMFGKIRTRFRVLGE